MKGKKFWGTHKEWNVVKRIMYLYQKPRLSYYSWTHIEKHKHDLKRNQISTNISAGSFWQPTAKNKTRCTHSIYCGAGKLPTSQVWLCFLRINPKEESVKIKLWQLFLYLFRSEIHDLYTWRINHNKRKDTLESTWSGGSRIYEGAVGQSNIRQGSHWSTVPAIELDTHILHFFVTRWKRKLHMGGI